MTNSLISAWADVALLATIIFAVVSTKKQLLPAFLFAVPIYIFNLFEGSFAASQGYKYHLTDAAISLIIILTLSKLALTNLRLRLQTISLWIIYLNLLGWVAYELYISSVFYNLACAAFYSLALVETVIFKGVELGTIRSRCNGFRFYCDNHPGIFRVRSGKKEKTS